MLVLGVIFSSGALFGQFSVGLGPSMMKNFGAPSSNFGFHIQGELCEDDESSMHGRVTFMPATNELVPTLGYVESLANPNSIDYIDYTASTSFINIKGGYKTYIGDGYEYGFAVYGGTSLGILIANVKLQPDEFDQTQYRVPDNFRGTGRLMALMAGLSGGVKYSLPPAGTIYFDAGIEYRLLPISNDSPALGQSSYIRNPLNFSFELGFRRDILW